MTAVLAAQSSAMFQALRGLDRDPVARRCCCGGAGRPTGLVRGEYVGVDASMRPRPTATAACAGHAHGARDGGLLHTAQETAANVFHGWQESVLLAYHRLHARTRAAARAGAAGFTYAVTPEEEEGSGDAARSGDEGGEDVSVVDVVLHKLPGGAAAMHVEHGSRSPLGVVGIYVVCAVFACLLPP